MWVLQVLVAMESSVSGRGCASGVAAARAALMLSKDCCGVANQSNTLELSLRHSVRGWSVRWWQAGNGGRSLPYLGSTGAS